jgi:hypothetical protein
MRLVWRDLRELRIYLGVLAWWVVLLSVPFWRLPVPVRAFGFAAVAAAPVLFMAWRKKSWTRAAYSVVSWCFATAGLVRGLLRRRRPARERIHSRVVHEPPQTLEPRYQHYA